MAKIPDPQAGTDKQFQESADADLANAQATAATQAAQSAAGDGLAVEKAKSSPKKKSILGIPEENVISWVPADFPPAVHEVITNAAKQRGVKIGDMLKGYLTDALRAHYPALQADAAMYTPAAKSAGGITVKGKKFADMTEEEQVAAAMTNLQKQEAALEKAKALIAQARERAAAAKNGSATV